MKIVRDGKEFELTDSEMEQAYRERETYFYGLDAKGEYEIMYDKECPYPDDVAQLIGQRAYDILSKNDGYWDYYWDAFQMAIKEQEEK